jgi:riboflavin biosynthesis pyrimidine reductase
MLLPTPTPVVDAAALYASGSRRPVGPRPWVAVNMIATADGAATDAEGKTGGLASAADREVLIAIRAVGDIVVAGAGTIRAENYGPARMPPELEAVRLARGQSRWPRIVVVSASLRLDPAARLFHEPADERPLIVTVEAADREARRRLEPLADIVVAGDDRVSWPLALAELRRATGAQVAVVEGGPMVIGQMLIDDVIDEMCLTVAPVMAGGEAPRIAHGVRPDIARAMKLEHLLEADGFLLLRYLVDHPSSPPTPVAVSPDG